MKPSSELRSRTRRRPTSGFKQLCVGLAAAIMLLGCGPSRRTRLAPEEIPFEALTASKSDLLGRLEAQSEAIETLQARVNLLAVGGGLSTEVLQTYPETTGHLLARRPSHIHLQGRSLLGIVTVFDMVSNGETFRVSIPPENQFITGPTTAVVETDRPIMNLRPQHIMEALFVDISAHLHDAGVISVLEEVREGRQRLYVLSFIDADDARLLEKIWIDRRDLTVARKQLFGESGVVETDATYSRYEHYGEDVTFPQEIHVQKPVIDYEVTIRFEETQLNLLTQDSQFELAPPSGFDVIVLDEASSIGSRAESP